MSRKRGVYILGCRRTPFGKFFGSLSHLSAVHLASEAILGLVSSFNIGTARSDIGVDGVILGNALSAGLGQAPARRAAILGGIPEHCPAELVNKVCASSLFAVKTASREIQIGASNLMIAGGMESMTRSPYFLDRLEKNKKFPLSSSPGKILKGKDYPLIDGMIHDGLFDVISRLKRTMGELADLCAKIHSISREEQEAYAHESFLRAYEAQRSGKFARQIIPVNGIFADEGIREPNIDKMHSLEPAFSEDGTVTAATSAQISDGAAVLLLGNSRSGRVLGVSPRIRIVDFVTHSQDPIWYTTAPAEAIGKILLRNKLKVKDIARFEVNEAFAVVPVFVMRKLNVSHEKVNIWGGAIAVGHPLGASGGRLMMNIKDQLIEIGGRYGIACACNGGGEAMAVLIENTLN